MDDQIKMIQYIAGDLELDIEFIQPWHLRISRDKKRLDYFPKSGRATWVSTNKWFTIEDIEKYLYDIWQPIQSKQ